MSEQHGIDEQARTHASRPQVGLNEEHTRIVASWILGEAGRLLQAGAFFRALGILCQIPGGADQQFILYDQGRNLPRLLDPPAKRVPAAGRVAVFDLLAATLRHLEVPELIKQIPAPRNLRQHRPAKELMPLLDQHKNSRRGLLALVAVCLDDLIIQPAEELAEALPAECQRWWPESKPDAGRAGERQTKSTGRTNRRGRVPNSAPLRRGKEKGT
jgi:hypothetical protein